MKLSVSNIGLSAYDHVDELAQLAPLGFSGLEVAPSRVWHDTWHGLTAQQVTNYRQQIETAELNVVGLHSLFFDHPELGLFKTGEARQQTLDFLVHLSAVCRDLGGYTLVYGGGRRRDELDVNTTTTRAHSFMETLLPRIESHGTCLCFEPLGPKDTDFLNTALETLAMVNSFNHPSFKVQLDAKALVENSEASLEIFQTVQDKLVHFHANEPGLAVIGSSGTIDHAGFGTYLKQIDYQGYISLEQRMFNEQNPLNDIQTSVSRIKKDYT